MIHRVTCLPCPWEASCDHGPEGVWTVHRLTEYAAERSLRAHRRECTHWQAKQ